MTRTKTARLSLTMPGPADSQNPSHSKEGHAPSKSVSGPTGLRRPESKTTDKKSTSEVYEQDPVSSRSESPSAPFSATSEQSRSPNSPSSPTFTSLPQYPPTPEKDAKNSRDQSKTFFQNLKASKSSAKIQSADSTIRRVTPDNNADDAPRALSKTKSTPDLRGTPDTEPVPDLPKLDRDEASQRSVSSSTSSHTIPRRPVGTAATSSKSNLTLTDYPPQSPASESQDVRKNGKLFPHFMKRNHSGRPEDVHYNMAKPGTPVSSKSPEPQGQGKGSRPPNRDRSTSRHTEDSESTSHEHHVIKTHLKDQRSQSFRDGTGSTLFKGFKTHTAKAAKEVGKAGKGFFRSRHSNNAPPPPDFSGYQVRVINLPLREQTRLTRIAKRLEDSKDKTEFWMPALPWRCIDYLNFEGCETEGLYRVPGSEREVRIWKAKFDQEHDVDLFAEEELYDINTVGSLFKSWLRELPDDVFPQDLQEALSKKYSGQGKAPEELKDLLSQLPPWNYYLLFAITCHLSLLHAYEDKNKMTFHNLFVCFAPALRMNGDCFRWLVGDWRSCWKGCATEKAALEQEYRIIDGDPSDSDDPSENTRVNDPPNSSNNSAEPTPKASAFQTSARPILQSPPPPKGHKESGNIMRNVPEHAIHSRDSSRNTMSRESNDREFGGAPKNFMMTPPKHQRSASQLPDLDFGKPISPTFAHHK